MSPTSPSMWFSYSHNHEVQFQIKVILKGGTSIMSRIKGVTGLLNTLILEVTLLIIILKTDILPEKY